MNHAPYASKPALSRTVAGGVAALLLAMLTAGAGCSGPPDTTGSSTPEWGSSEIGATESNDQTGANCSDNSPCISADQSNCPNGAGQYTGACWCTHCANPANNTCDTLANHQARDGKC
jgi:hypothetical protein